jgi:predicted transcriptional regulator YdeE
VGKSDRRESTGGAKEMTFSRKLAIIFLIAIPIFGDDTVPAKIIGHIEGFTVIGVSVRTNNAREQTPDGQIGKIWQRLSQEKFLANIPNKADKNIIAVYTNYAGDKNGDYTFILGAKVSSDKEIPAGMVAVKISAGRYAKYTSEKGPAYKVVPNVWKRIWETSSSTPAGQRAYKTDFELYDQRAVDPEKSQVDVYVGIN